jgi:hypothetical protein
MDTEKLRQKLKEKIGEKRINRNTKKAKEHVLESTLKDMGLDKKLFENDLKAVGKSGFDVSMSLNDIMNKPEFKQQL